MRLHHLLSQPVDRFCRPQWVFEFCCSCRPPLIDVAVRLAVATMQHGGCSEEVTKNNAVAFFIVRMHLWSDQFLGSQAFQHQSLSQEFQEG
jgi:hypothetical protein